MVFAVKSLVFGLLIVGKHAEGDSISQRGARRWEYCHSQGELNVKPKTALLIDKFGWIVFALAGMILWVAMALAGDALEIGKSYVVRDHTKGPLAYQFTKVPLRRGETITILEREERNSYGIAVYLTQRESGKEYR